MWFLNDFYILLLHFVVSIMKHHFFFPLETTRDTAPLVLLFLSPSLSNEVVACNFGWFLIILTSSASKCVL